MGRGKVFLFCYLAHLVLHHVTDGEQRFLQLPVVDLCQEVRLVFYGVRTGAKPFEGKPTPDPSQREGRLMRGKRSVLFLCGGVVAGGDEIVVVTALLMEGSELDEAVAHDVRIRRISRPYLFHRIARHLIPVFLVAIYHFQLTVILVTDSGCHFQVFLGGTVPFLFFLGTDLDVEAVGLQSLAHQFVEHHGRIYTS